VLADRGLGENRILRTGPGRAWLTGLELPPIPHGIIQDRCRLLDALAGPIGRLEREIAGLAKPDPGSRRSWPCPIQPEAQQNPSEKARTGRARVCA
jgi:hypothetical protein